MTAAEREALYEGFLAENGTYSGAAWEQSFESGGNTYMLFVNGGHTAMNVSKTYSAPAVITKLLSSGADAAYKNGSFTLTLPPGGVAFFKLGNGSEAGLFVDDLVLHKLSDEAVWKGNTAVLYGVYNGVPEILEYVENGETVKLGTGAYILKAFSWATPLKPLSAAVVYTTP